MGSAIAERIKSNYEVIVFDKDENKTKSISGIKPFRTAVDVVKEADCIIIAVKPQDINVLLKDIREYAVHKLVISIAAGTTTDFISKYLPRSRIIRTMPNLLGRIGEGITFLYKGHKATDDDLNFAKELFANLGKVWEIEEKRMPFATAASGTAPALSCYFIETHHINYSSMPEDQRKGLIDFLEKGARAVNFSQKDARILAESIVDGVIHLLDREKLSPSALRTQITSRGGTTAAALEALHKGLSVEEAFKAAAKRAEELSK